MASRKPRWDERSFKVEALQRDYTYTVFVTRKGAKVRCITAGCRYWQSFAEAFKHYRGEVHHRPEWSDEAIYSLAVVNFVKAARVFSQREDARCALRMLEKMVRKYERRRWNARRR